MDRNQVTAYRAVATAAAREARNSRRLIERIQRKAGIELEVIGSDEEARLVCAAVRWTLGDRIRPRVIFDLGGGSLEINFFQRGVLERRVGLPLGTIRLMETYGIAGAIAEDNVSGCATTSRRSWKARFRCGRIFRERLAWPAVETRKRWFVWRLDRWWGRHPRSM